MESEPRAASKKASREASEWFVFLQDDPHDLALRRRFDDWLGASAENAAAWSETLRASSLAESLLPFDARDWAAAKTTSERRRSASGPGRRWPGRRWVVGLSAGAAACLLLLAGPTVLLRLQSDYATGTAQTQDVELQDGSIVTLAPSSAIAVSYAGAERQVKLLSGEAFFSVKPNAERPFHVLARDVRASVLGTSFDVQLEKRGVGVSVREGKVRVDTADNAEVLEAGQSIHLAAAGGVQRGSQSPQTIGAWRQGQLVMEEGSLGSAVEQLDRYFDGTIILAGEQLSERPVTGIFDLRDPEGALRAMAKALGVKVSKVTPWLLIVSAP